MNKLSRLFSTKIITYLVVALFTFGIGSEVFAKSYSKSGGGFSKSSGSGGWGKSKPSSSPKVSNPSKTKTGGWGTSKTKTDPKAVTNTTNPKPKEVVPNSKYTESKSKYTKAISSPEYKKMDKDLTRDVGKGGKAYKDPTAARQDLSKDLNKKLTTSNYKSVDELPSYIPKTHSVGGNSYTTVVVGGRPGYYNPSGAFMAYVAADLITDTMMYSYGYRPYAAYNQPQTVVHTNSGGNVFWIILSVVGVIVVIVIIIAVVEA